MEFPQEITRLADEIVELLRQRGQSLATAESCTGGLIAGAITAIPGSSQMFFGGYVTYANEAKVRMLGVGTATLDRHGAVSEQTVREMAEGARTAAGTDWAISVSGVAGPGGGSQEKPVGLVYFGLARAEGTTHRRVEFGDVGRSRVRQKAVGTALSMVLAALQDGA